MNLRLTSLFIIVTLLVSCSSLKLWDSSSNRSSTERIDTAPISPDSLVLEYDYNFLQTLYLDAKTALLIGDTSLAVIKYEEALEFIATKNGYENFPAKFEKLNKKIDLEYGNLLRKYPQYGENTPASFLRELDITDADLNVDTLNTNIPSAVSFGSIPVVENNTVKNVLNSLLKKRKKVFENYLRRSTKYLPYIKQIFRDEGLPEDLVYLASIESGYNPIAYSRAHASGMWQFISGTAKFYGLKINQFVDERRDFIKATKAAAKHLKDLYNARKDWFLALANYNCSSRRIDRAIRRHRTKNFWRLRSLPRQTRSYIPLYLAAIKIFKNPEEYGFNVDYEPVLTFDIVEIDKSYDLTDIAECAGTDVKTIREEYNPELRYTFTPPLKNGTYKLRIPAGTKNEFLKKLAALPPEKSSNYEFYTVKKGENISNISKKYEVKEHDLRIINSLWGKKVKTGDEIIVPISEASKKYSYAISSTGEFGRTYRVRRGDTLERIARRFGVKVRDLMKWNGLSSHMIYINQRLYVFSGAPLIIPAGSNKFIYTVKRGDTLSEIAERYGVGLSKLRRWNNLWRNTIYPGQRLSIYTQIPDKVGVHTVRRGESLDKISRIYGITIKKLKELNGLSGNTIYPDQKLYVASKSETEQVQKDSNGNGDEINGNTSKSYKVRYGDTLWDIAKKYGISVKKLKAANNLRSNNIRPGIILVIPN